MKVLINTDSTQDCLLGTNAQEELGFTLVSPDGQEIPRSPAPTAERYSKELEDKDSTSKTSLPTENSTFTVRLLTTCLIPGYRGHTVKAKVEGDCSQVQGKEFLFEPDWETLQKVQRVL